MRLASGERVGSYEILGHLGSGGMGEVYRARDVRLGRTVAIKVVAPHIAGSADADLRARFEREARAIAALDDPHICSVYDVGERDGMLYLVMPCLEGQTLAARLASRASAAARRRPAHRPGGRRRDGAHAPRPHHASRSQARQHHVDEHRGEAAGLRPGEGVGAIDGERGARRHATRARPAGHDGGHPRRDGALHGARAGRGPRGRRAERRLGLRRGGLRDGDRSSSVRRSIGRGDHRGDPARSAATDLVAPATGPSPAGPRRGAVSRQGPGRALAEHRRCRRRVAMDCRKPR